MRSSQAGRKSDLHFVFADKLAMIASTVSSKMIGAMARIEGFQFVECLTRSWIPPRPCIRLAADLQRPRCSVELLGFKFIGNTALSLTEQGYEVPFGYEEAIGFM